MREQVVNGLLDMFLRFEVVSPDENSLAVVVFAAGCGIVGLLAVILDGALYFLHGRSLLKLRHGWNSFVFLFVWPLGAMIIAFVGQLIQLFLVSLAATVVVGFTWPFLFTKIIERAKENQTLEPEQAIIEEDEV